jgi:hypothetical protein
VLQQSSLGAMPKALFSFFLIKSCPSRKLTESSALPLLLNKKVGIGRSLFLAAMLLAA